MPTGSSAPRATTPMSDMGSALSILDVLNSAIGIAAPIYGGLLLGQLGVGMQPIVSLAHYALLLILVHVLVSAGSLPPARGGEQLHKEKKN